MKNFVIAIPSYKRAELLKKNTLNMLISSHISPSLIYIFVANREEYNDYVNLIPKGHYKAIVIAKPGLANARNFISSYFKKGQYIVNLDDDIKSILQLVGKVKETAKLRPINNLNTFFTEAFKVLEDTNSHLWGISPSGNPYFMNQSISVGLMYIVGACWGCINDPQIKITGSEKEDFERSILYFKKYGELVRFNNITIKTNYWTNPGGMQSELKDRVAEAERRTKELMKRYPEYVTQRWKRYKKGDTVKNIIDVNLKRKTLRKIPLNP